MEQVTFQEIQHAFYSEAQNNKVVSFYSFYLRYSQLLKFMASKLRLIFVIVSGFDFRAFIVQYICVQLYFLYKQPHKLNG